MINIKLKKILKEKRLSISKIHDLTGISRSTLTTLANNESKGIQFDTLDTLCSALNVEPNDIIDFVQVPRDNKLLYTVEDFTGNPARFKGDRLYKTFIYIYEVKLGAKKFFYGITFKLIERLRSSNDDVQVFSLSYTLTLATKVYSILNDNKPDDDQINYYDIIDYHTHGNESYELLKEYIDHNLIDNINNQTLIFNLINLKLPKYLVYFENEFIVETMIKKNISSLTTEEQNKLNLSMIDNDKKMYFLTKTKYLYKKEENIIDLLPEILESIEEIREEKISVREYDFKYIN